MTEKYQILVDIIEHLEHEALAFKNNRVQIVARIDEVNSSSEKNYIRFFIGAKTLPSNDPGLSFMQKYTYFQNNQDMVAFCIRHIFGKPVYRGLRKKFSKYIIEVEKLAPIKAQASNKILEHELPVKSAGLKSIKI